MECEERNGEISLYQVMYSNVMENVSVKMFRAGGLIPRNSYTFNVTAINPSLGIGPPATITVNTSTPEGKLQVATLSTPIISVM